MTALPNSTWSVGFSQTGFLQKTNGELLHISLVMLLTSIFYLWFAWDAIVCENAFELIASAVLGAAVCARIIYFVVGSSTHAHLACLLDYSALLITVLFCCAMSLPLHVQGYSDCDASYTFTLQLLFILLRLCVTKFVHLHSTELVDGCKFCSAYVSALFLHCPTAHSCK